MSVLELIGFIIAFIVFLFLKSNGKKVAPSGLPRHEDEDTEDPLVKLSATLNRTSHQEKKREVESFRHAQVHKKRKASPLVASSNQHHRLPLRPSKSIQTAISMENEEEINRKQKQSKPSRIRKIIRTLPQMENLVIYSEIMSKPKSLRSDEWP